MNLEKYEELVNYSIVKSTTPSKIADQLESETRKKVEMSGMLVGKMEASVLGLIVRLLGAKRVLEFGTFTGYSALVFAENLPEDGEVHSLDINSDTVDFGKKFWKKSDHFSKIHSHIGPALETVNKLEGEFDLIFIDADKENYLNYFKLGLDKLSTGGAIVLDNTLWGGSVIDENDNLSSTKAIREVNNYIENNKSLYGSLLPIRDGMFVVIKK